MRIQITAGGVYNSAGQEIPVGEVLTVNKEPKGWAGRYTVLKDAEGKTAATGKGGGKPPEDPQRAELEKLDVDTLAKLAADEKIDLKGASAKGDMIAHILKAREDKAKA